MKSFKASNTQTKSLLVMEIGSIVILIIGIGQLIYCNNHHCDSFFEVSAIMYIIGGLLFQLATIFAYLNTTFEVILNDDDLCINKAGFTNAKSLLIDYKNIKSVSYTTKELPITHRTVTSIVLTTNIGTKIINNIENADKCSKLIKFRIENGSFENYISEIKNDNHGIFYYDEDGYLHTKESEK